MTQAQKAAAILAAMGRDRAAQMLKHFKREELRVLIDAGQTLKTIPQPDLKQLVGEFEAAFGEGAGLLDSADHIRRLVDEELTTEELDAIFGRERAGQAEDGNTNVWSTIESIDAAGLIEFFRNENPLVMAYVCSRLGPKKTAEVLVAFERPMRSMVIGLMLKLSSTSESAIRTIEAALAEAFSGKTDGSADNGGKEKVADVLSEFAPGEADEIFDDLGTIVEPKNVEDVKRLVFRFDDISQLSQTHRSILFDAVPTDVMADALREEAGDVREAFLSAVSQRTRRMIEAELSGNAVADPKARDAARQRILVRAKQLIGEGKIAPATMKEAA